MIGVSDQQGTTATMGLTPNEQQLILTLREMKPRDKLIIIKQAVLNKVELFVRIERAVLMPRENL